MSHPLSTVSINIEYGLNKLGIDISHFQFTFEHSPAYIWALDLFYSLLAP